MNFACRRMLAEIFPALLLNRSNAALAPSSRSRVSLISRAPTRFRLRRVRRVVFARVAVAAPRRAFVHSLRDEHLQPLAHRELRPALALLQRGRASSLGVEGHRARASSQARVPIPSDDVPRAQRPPLFAQRRVSPARESVARLRASARSSVARVGRFAVDSRRRKIRGFGRFASRVAHRRRASTLARVVERRHPHARARR